MTRDSLKGQIEEQLARSGLTLASLTPATGLDLILRCFRAHPNIGDVSCTWGQVTRYGPVEDGFQITCWFANEEPSFPTLVLAFKIGAAGALPFWNASCPTPDQIDTFRARVEAAVPFQRWGQSHAAAVTLFVADFNYAHGRFDCWGVRDPKRPIVSMTDVEWAKSSDVGLMLRWFRQEWRGGETDLNRFLRGYCLACCRRVWPLLTFAESRQGVEVAERYLRGEVTRDEYQEAEHEAGGPPSRLIMMKIVATASRSKPRSKRWPRCRRRNWLACCTRRILKMTSRRAACWPTRPTSPTWRCATRAIPPSRSSVTASSCPPRFCESGLARRQTSSPEPIPGRFRLATRVRLATIVPIG